MAPAAPWRRPPDPAGRPTTPANRTGERRAIGHKVGLTGAEGTPSAAGLLSLAIIPAILIALFFAWTRRPSGAHAGAEDEGDKGLMAESNGRHGIATLFDKLLGR